MGGGEEREQTGGGRKEWRRERRKKGAARLKFPSLGAQSGLTEVWASALTKPTPRVHGWGRRGEREQAAGERIEKGEEEEVGRVA